MKGEKYPKRSPLWETDLERESRGRGLHWHKKILTSGLNNKHLFITVLQTGKSKVKALAGSVSNEDQLPDS